MPNMFISPLRCHGFIAPATYSRLQTLAIARVAYADATKRRCFSDDREPASLTSEDVFGEANHARVVRDLKSVVAVRDLSWAKKGKLPQASVLVLMCTDRGKPALIFTKRTEHLSSYSGQVSFPGGKMDADDKDATHTALRETEEEIGLAPDGVKVWGELNAVPSRNYDSAVTPVLAYCGETDVSGLTPNPNEVDHIFTRTLDSLCRPDNHHYTRFRVKRGATQYTLPAFTGGEHRIWGLTAIIVHLTLTLLLPEVYTSQVKHIGKYDVQNPPGKS